MKLIEEIKSLIKEANETNDITALININMKIRGYLIYVAELEIPLLRQKLMAYNDRKNFEAKHCLVSASGITKAEKEAIVNSKDLRDLEISTEVEWMATRNFRTQCNEFCEALGQKIAALRKEYETIKQHQQ